MESKLIRVLYYYLVRQDRLDIIQILVSKLETPAGSIFYEYKNKVGNTVELWDRNFIKPSLETNYGPNVLAYTELDTKILLTDILKEAIDIAFTVSLVLDNILSKKKSIDEVMKKGREAFKRWRLEQDKDEEEEDVAAEPKAINRDDYTLVLIKGWWWIAIQTTKDTYVLQPKCGRFNSAENAQAYLDIMLGELK